MRIERALVGMMCLVTAAGVGCNSGRLAYNLPPSSRLMEPGPGVGGPGPGVIPPAGYPYGLYGGAVGRYGDGMGAGMPGGCPPGTVPPGDCAPGMPMAANNGQMHDGAVMQASYKLGGHGGYAPTMGPGPAACACGGHHGACGDEYGDCYGGADFGGADFGGVGDGAMRPGSTEAYADGGAMAAAPTSQIAFLGEEGVQVSWDVGGYGMFDSVPLVVPGRQDFFQGAIYRLRLANIPGRPGVELFPTLEVAPVTPRTDAYLAHSPIPVQFTAEDFDQVLSGNFVTKVIYLPDPEFQELALAGVETLVSTRLAPGVDPIAEADRRGSILAILRMGNKDLRRGNVAAPPEYQPQELVPASHTMPAGGAPGGSYEDQAYYEEEFDAAGHPMSGGISQAQYCAGAPAGGCGPYGDGSVSAMPMGMSTAAFAPPVVPPHMVAGAPTWGMPITGTPIGLPGPPHIPLGVPAGLQQHQMHNRTRVLLPPPVSKLSMTVKQRPGLNYPRPVNHIHMNETQREPFNFFGLFSGFGEGRHGGGAHHGANPYPGGFGGAGECY